jgi:polysaccharide biosynthesis transport protein
MSDNQEVIKHNGNGNGNGNDNGKAHGPQSIAPISPRERFEIVPYAPEMAFGPRLHLRDYYHMLERRKWIILACVVLAVTAAAVYTSRLTPIYQASAQLEIDQEGVNVLPYQDFNSANQNYNYLYEEFLQTQIKHITSRSLAQRVAIAAGIDKKIPDQPVVEKSRLSAMWAFITGKKSEDTPVKPLTSAEKIQIATDDIIAGLEVLPVKDSRVVAIIYNSPDPKEAARIANILTQQYIDYNFQAKYDATSRATDFLQKQLIDLKIKVEQSEEALINYARQNNILNVSEKQDVVLQTLTDINSQLTQARGARMDKESVYKTLAQATTTENFPQGLRTSMIEKLESGLLSDEQELAKMTIQLGASMPQVKQLESRVKQTRTQLEHERRLAIDNASKEYETAMAREKLLAAAFDKQKVQANELSESSIQYNIIKREVETNKQLYDGLLQRMKEAGVAAGLKSSNIRVVDQAEIPISPSSPNMPKNLAMSLMLGLMGGFGLAFFLNYLDNTVKTPEDVEDLIGLPSLGLIPSLASTHSGYGYLPAARRRRAQSLALATQGVELASLTSSGSMIAEAFRGLRTALLLSDRENPPKIIMVTSSRAGEGKTTTVCNTALSLAQTGKRVLIIDCDLRRPKIAKIFQEKGNGLSEYLTGQVGFVEATIETTIPNLFIMHAGTPPPHPGELLGSTKMQEALLASAQVFDYILIDTPPLMSVTDPLIIAPMADGVILVTKGAKNPPEILKRAKKSLDLVHARILGVLCNNVDLHSSSYNSYYHQYSEYSSYVSEDTQHPSA